MGMIVYTVTTPAGVEEFLDTAFATGRHYGTMAVTAECTLDELALRRLGLQHAAVKRDFRFRPEIIQFNPKDFFMTAQEVEENGDGATLHISLNGDQVIISIAAGELHA